MSSQLSLKQKENLDFFQANLQGYLVDPVVHGKYLVIHNRSVVKSFDTYESAINYSANQLPRDEFIIQQVLAENETINFLISAVG